MTDEWDEAWGPMPSHWEMLRATFWHWRVGLWRRARCKVSGHTRPIWVPNFDAPGGAWHCKRCGAWQDEEGQWHP